MCKYERERKWEAVEAKKEAECILFADEVMWKWESVWVSVCAPACVRECVCARMCERVCVCTHVWERVCACEWEWFSPDKTHNCNVCIYWSEIPIFDFFPKEQENEDAQSAEQLTSQRNMDSEAPQCKSNLGSNPLPVKPKRPVGRT